MRRFNWISSVAALALTCSLPGATFAATTVNGDANPNRICVAEGAGRTHVCLDGAEQAWNGYPLTINGNDGNDAITVNQAGACTCVCNGFAGDVNYAGSSITINGGKGIDTITGGNGTTTTHGNASGDKLGGYSSGSVDTIFGDANDDTIIDLGGIHEQLYGGTGVDCVRDNNCAWDACDCGGQVGDATGTCDVNCSNCPVTGSNCTFSCPP